jgi:hypothetical protein
VFGTPDEFTRPDAPSGLCAILFNVYRPAEPRSGEQHLAARIVLLKPRLIDTAPQDLIQYRSMSPSFPNESTADQFFNQAQWES